MTNIGDGFKNIFLAGIGALAYTGEKGKELNEELKRKAEETTTSVRDSFLEARMSLMTPEERTAFAAKAAEFAEAMNAADAEAAAAEAAAEAEEAAEEEAEPAAEEPAPEPEDAEE